jgi:tRNA-2-methylthio-N6-dimethylallyladenosine synthase
MNYHLIVTGCQQNIYDGNKITHLLEKMGYLKSTEEFADVIIVVACSVRQKPVDRIFGKFKSWNKLPQKPKIIIVGCVLPSDKKKLRSRVHAILKANEIDEKLPKILDCFENMEKYTEKNSEFVPIMYGCNNFCSYCVVPYTRGREVSRSGNEIIEEIKTKITSGIDEIILLGQNVNSYKPDFVALLEKIENVKGLNKITFLTSHPKDLSNKLIDWMAKSQIFSGELHLPVQSGDNDILKKMNRNYTIEKYMKIVENCKSEIKNLRLSTDIIVGFPGETEKQFENTLELCKKIKFDKAYISQYSERSGTPSAKLPDDVSATEKKRRWKILDNLINHKK